MQYSHYRLRKCLTDVFFQKQYILARKKNDDSMISDFMILIFGLYDI